MYFEVELQQHLLIGDYIQREREGERGREREEGEGGEEEEEKEEEEGGRIRDNYIVHFDTKMEKARKTGLGKEIACSILDL